MTVKFVVISILVASVALLSYFNLNLSHLSSCVKLFQFAFESSQWPYYGCFNVNLSHINDNLSCFNLHLSHIIGRVNCFSVNMSHVSRHF